MFIQVDDIVINTDNIKYVIIQNNSTKLKIFFGVDFYKSVSFPNIEDLNRFLKLIGRDRIFA